MAGNPHTAPRRSPTGGGTLSIRHQVLVLVVTVACAACGSDEASAPSPSGLATTPDAPPGWEVRELFRLGQVDGPPELTFGEVEAVEIDAGGNVYVLDSRASVVRVFDSEGAYVRDLGSEGEGPGEFLRPGGMVLDGEGGLWVVDWGDLAYTRFDTRRPNARPETWRRGFSAGWGGPWNAVVTADGTLWEPTSIRDPGGEVVPVFLGLRPDGAEMMAVDTVHRVANAAAPSWTVEARQSGDGPVVSGVVPVPFHPALEQWLDPRGGYWEGNASTPRFVRFSMEGDTLEVRGREATPTPLTEEHIERAVSDLRASFGDALQVDRSDLPEHLPHWGSLWVDPAGRLWVSRFRIPGGPAGAPTEWEIYGEDGGLLGTLRLHLDGAIPRVGAPPPRSADDRLVGTVQDDLDVRYVVVYEVAGASVADAG